MNFGFLSILPPVVAVLLAVRYKNVLLALFAGVYVGSVIKVGYNPITGLTSLFKDVLFVEVAQSSHGALLVMMTFIGGFVAVVTQSGGAAAFAEKAASLVKSRMMTQVAAWVGGIVIFFSDSANPLLLGPIFQPIADKMRVSREKLAWIIDSTASPVCILVPIIGWGIFIQSLIGKQFKTLGIQEDPFYTFLAVVPYQFYALGTLMMVPLVALVGYEFSAMYEAEKRTMETGEPMWPDAKPLRPTESIDLPEGTKPTVSMITVPLFVLFITLFGILGPSGFPLVPVKGKVLWSTLSAGYFLGALSCMYLMVKNKQRTAEESLKIFVDGCKNMAHILMILVLAWSLGAICKTLGTDSFIVSICRGTVPTFLVPSLLFVTGALISFSTGSAWGTFAILIPIAIPLAKEVGLSFPLVIGAVLSGGLFGDHCSPISDTTIMSSMGAACDHIDHVKTQVPYACCVASASLIAYIVAGLIDSPWTLVLALTLVVAIVVIAGRLRGKALKMVKEA